jgi:crotonobetainyl-CoA:carnitine CoA-transferase CaiB-like acyl-CoA transferase
MTASASDGGAMLSGIKVLDLTSVVFGPYCTQILADLGAEVTKVEPPEIGDVARYLGKPAVSAGMSPTFMALNGGKQSRAIDLKSEAGAAQMQALLAECDVFVLNVRGKAAERLGLDYESVRAINPQVIYVHCVGFGQEGPYADLQAYDDVIQAATGATTLASRVDGDPRARYIPSLIADKVAGLHAAYGVLAAVIHKLRTGEGQRIEVPMFEAFAQFLLVEHLGGLTFDPPNAPVCYFRQIDPDRQPFPTSDGYISIVAYTASAWPAPVRRARCPRSARGRTLRDVRGADGALARAVPDARHADPALHFRRACRALPRGADPRAARARHWRNPRRSAPCRHRVLHPARASDRGCLSRNGAAGALFRASLRTAAVPAQAGRGQPARVARAVSLPSRK